MEAVRERRGAVPAVENWKVTVSSSTPTHEAKFAVDGDMTTWWRSANEDPQTIEVDMGREVVLSGFSIQWGTPWGTEYEVLLSRDGLNWSMMYRMEQGDGDWDTAVWAPTSARYARVRVERGSSGNGCAIRVLELRGLADRIRVTVNGVSAPEALAVFNGDDGSSWHHVGDDGVEVELDLRRPREVGSLRLDWGALGAPVRMAVSVSLDRQEWQSVADMPASGDSFDVLTHEPVPVRYIRLRLQGSSSGDGIEIVRMTLRGEEGAPNPVGLYEVAARAAPPGMYPVQFLPRQNYWTMIGNLDGGASGFLDEYGVFDPRAGGPTLTPVIQVGDEWRSWAQASHVEHRLAGVFLPLPELEWHFEDGLTLDIRAVSTSDAEKKHGILPVVKYELVNEGNLPRSGHLVLLVRPVQVIPEWMGGGIAPLYKLNAAEVPNGFIIRSQGDALFAVAAERPEFTAAAFDGGDIIETLLDGGWPSTRRVSDEMGLASGAVRVPFALEPGGRMSVVASGFPKQLSRQQRHWWSEQSEFFDRAWVDEIWAWSDRAGRLAPKVARSDMADCLRAQMAWILTSREGLNRQVLRSSVPGDVYELDTGVVSMAAALRAGRPGLVRDYLEWFAGWIGPDGQVPPYAPLAADEDRSLFRHSYAPQGQFIFSVMEYYRFQNDTMFLKEQWPAVKNALSYLERARARGVRRRDWRRWTPVQREMMTGLIPVRGLPDGRMPNTFRYSDQIWSLIAWKEAQQMASLVGEVEDMVWAHTNYMTLKADIQRSIATVLEKRQLSVLPETVENPRPDFKTAALLFWPLNEPSLIDPAVVQSTLDEFYARFLDRRKPGGPNWVPTDEMRYLIPFSRMGRGDYARELVYAFLELRQPKGWHFWGEIAGRDPTIPGQIGEMPDVLASSYFVLGVRSLLVRESENALHLLRGVIPEWIQHGDEGMNIYGMITQFGPLDLAVKWKEKVLFVEIGGAATPPAGYRLYWPRAIRPDSVLVNGVPLADAHINNRYCTLPHDFKGTVRVLFPFRAPWPRDP